MNFQTEVGNKKIFKNLFQYHLYVRFVQKKKITNKICFNKYPILNVRWTIIYNCLFGEVNNKKLIKYRVKLTVVQMYPTRSVAIRQFF